MHPFEINRRLYETYENLEEVKHYYGILAIYGLARTAVESEDEQLKQKVRAILNRFPDQIDHPTYNFPSYRIGGIARAYANLSGLMPESAALVREYADELMTAPRDPDGIVKNPHRPAENLVWIDCAMAACCYLAIAGKTFNHPAYFNEGIQQGLKMYNLFRDPDNGLLHQAKNFNGPGRLSEDHWSRGNGWGFIALTELLHYLPVDFPGRSDVVDAFRRHAVAMLPFQTRRGMWRQEIPLQYSYEESSGTALILYGYGIGLRLGLLEPFYFRPAFEKGIRGLLSVAINPDFSTENSCPGCLCPGEGDEKGTVKAYVTLKLPYRNEHHSFGPIMLALVEAYKNGMTDLPAPGRNPGIQ
mgnify:CR=1 FL=1